MMNSARTTKSDLRFILCLTFLLVSLPSVAAADSFYLEDLTWPEVKERMAHGTDTIIIPSGGTEQNGPHIVIGKHNRIVHFTSVAIAKQLGNALAAPVIAYVPEGAVNPPDGHMLFPGTISVSDEHFAGILEDAARSFKAHGFKRICFIGDHGGNQAAQKKVADLLNKEWSGSGVKVIAVSDYYEDKDATAWAKGKKLGGKDAQAHAGFMDTAEAMAVDRKNVREKLITSDNGTNFSKTGVLGDPTGASTEYGRQLLAFKVKAAVDQIKRETGQ